jgi:copper resistance protein B
VNAAVQEVPEFGVGSGLNDIELGFRLRYEIRREYAPYVGVSWLRRFAGTAGFARLAGDAVSDVAAVGGLRVWF